MSLISTTILCFICFVLNSWKVQMYDSSLLNLCTLSCDARWFVAQSSGK